MHVAPKMYLEVLVVTPVARRESRWSMELEEKGKQIVGIKLDSLLYLQQGTDLFQQFFAKDCEMKTLTLEEEKSSLKFVIKI